MRYLVVGDIHGCFEELVQLIGIFDPQDQDHIVLVGDLIHKGPWSTQVLRLVTHWLARDLNVTLVLGNHEEKHLRWLQHEQKRLETGKSNPMQHVEAYEDIEISSAQIELIRDRAQLFYQGPGFIVVHGGINPRTQVLPAESRYYHMDRQTQNQHRDMLRLRFVDKNNHMVSLGEETTEHRFWAPLYDGRFGHAYFGHQPFLQATPRTWAHATGIDLGCCYGSYLCGVVLDSQGVEQDVISVRALAAYTDKIFTMNPLLDYDQGVDNGPSKK